MSKRSAFYKAPKFKPEVRKGGRAEPVNRVPPKKEKVDLLDQPVKSESDNKVYK